MTYQQMEEEIAAVPRFGTDSGPENLKRYLKLMNNPEDSLRVIHVAGTNGKGSVSAFIESILREAGYRTGLFTSPHLIKMNERFRINFLPVDDDTLIQAWKDVRQVLEEGEKRGYSSLKWFEIIYLMGLLIFSDSDVDYCILETGLGGRLDATVTSHPLICVITSISMDHEKILGDTIESIAFEKAGILKEGVPAVVFDEKNGVFPVILSEAKRKNVHIEKVSCEDVTILKKRKNKIDFSINSSYYRCEELYIFAYAKYQVYNAALALVALKMIQPDIGEDIVRKGLRNMRWPGRMEEILPGVFLDGAHNPGAVARICETLEQWEEEKSLLFAVSDDKDYSEMIRMLSRICWKCIYVTRIKGDRGAPVLRVQECFSNNCSFRILTFEDIEEAFLEALRHKEEDERLICIGSLYLVGEIRRVSIDYGKRG